MSSSAARAGPLISGQHAPCAAQALAGRCGPANGVLTTAPPRCRAPELPRAPSSAAVATAGCRHEERPLVVIGAAMAARVLEDRYMCDATSRSITLTAPD